MPHTIVNPVELHDPTGFGYSHIARVSGELVLVAGQYAAGPDGSVTTTGFAGQVEDAFDNLGTALRAVGLDFADVAQLRTFVVDHDLDKLAIIGAAVTRRWAATPPTQTLIGVAALALPGMLFEVDAVATRD